MVGVEDEGLYRIDDRWALGDQPLHCGDRLHVRVGGQWLPGRIEYEDRTGWVLVVPDGVRLVVCHALSVRRMPSFPGR